MKLPDIIPGRSDAVVLLGAGLLLAYVGSGGWTEERWRQAGMAGGVIWAAAATGTLRGEARGFQRGFNTYNPELHRNDPPDDPVPFDAAPDLPIEPPEFPPPVMEVIMAPPPPPPPPAERRSPQGETKAGLYKFTRLDLMKMARTRGMGGRWLNAARKAEIVERLMKG